MCRYCEEPCWRDGSEGECAYTDAEWMRIDAEVKEVSEGTVRCVICGRWHSGMTVNDTPTTHCEACDPIIKVRTRAASGGTDG